MAYNESEINNEKMTEIALKNALVRELLKFKPTDTHADKLSKIYLYINYSGCTFFSIVF